jgi:hypothetical protein
VLISGEIQTHTMFFRPDVGLTLVESLLSNNISMNQYPPPSRSVKLSNFLSILKQKV